MINYERDDLVIQLQHAPRVFFCALSNALVCN